MRRTQTKLLPSKNKLKKNREGRMQGEFLDLLLAVWVHLVMEPMQQAKHLGSLRMLECPSICQSKIWEKFQLLTWECRSLVSRIFKKICKNRFLEDNLRNVRNWVVLILELLKLFNNSNYSRTNRHSRKWKETNKTKKYKTLKEIILHKVKPQD